jgi:hypothetical protein
MRAVHQQTLAKKQGASADCKKANTTPSIKSTFGGEQFFNRHLHEEWHSVRIVKMSKRIKLMLAGAVHHAATFARAQPISGGEV